jgi:hypothetical protein
MKPKSTKLTKEEIVTQYEEKSEAILVEMFQVLSHAQRKVDDDAYRKVLEKVQHEL